jgi:hypothetical protein
MACPSIDNDEPSLFLESGFADAALCNFGNR